MIKFMVFMIIILQCIIYITDPFSTNKSIRENNNKLMKVLLTNQHRNYI